MAQAHRKGTRYVAFRIVNAPPGQNVPATVPRADRGRTHHVMRISTHLWAPGSAHIHAGSDSGAPSRVLYQESVSVD
jgi:hypothetical protein